MENYIIDALFYQIEISEENEILHNFIRSSTSTHF